MGQQKGEFIGVEQILVRDRVDRARDVESKVGVGAEIAVLIFDLGFRAFAISPRPVELGKHHRLAKLAVVDQIGGDLVVGIQPHCETGKQFLVHADVEIMRALREHRIVIGNSRLVRGVGEQREVRLRRLRLHRRGEIAGVAGVEGRSVERLVHQRGARAELVGIDELIQLIEANPVIEGELAGQLPLVLDVGAEIPAQQRIGIVDGERRRRNRPGIRIDRKHRSRYRKRRSSRRLS